jgi:hypothetical protein
LPNTPRARAFWSDPKQQKKMTGKAAWDLYQTQKRGAKSDWGVHTPGLASDELPSMIDDLIQFNIEGVSVRYCDDLAAYWKGVQEVIKDADYVRPPELYRKAPEDKAGWIVELRGYTFHHKKATFVLDALLDNIRLRGDVKTPPAGDQPAGAQPAQTAADQPSGTPAAPPKHVVVGQITHPVLYLNVSKPTSEVGQFEYISQSHLADVIRGPAAAGPGGPGMMPGAPAGGAPMMQGPGGPGGAGMAGSAAGDGAGAPTAPTRDGWAALGSDHAGGGGAGAGRGMPGMPGGPGGKGAGGRLTVPTMPGGPGGPVMPGAPGGAGAAPQAGASNAAHWRTEFVIFFVWKEWTPSDELRGQGAAATENKAP